MALTVYFRQPPALIHPNKQQVIDAINDEIANAPADRFTATFDQVRNKLWTSHSIDSESLPDGVLHEIFKEMGLEVYDE